MKAPSASDETVVHAEGDTMQLWAVDPPGNLRKFDRGHIRQVLPHTFEFTLKTKHRLKHLGVRFSGTSEQNAIVSGG